MPALVASPRVGVAAGGVPLLAGELRGLAAVRVQSRLSQPSLCELTFCDPPGPFDALYRLTPGATLRLSVPGQDAALFDGEVTAVEHVFGPAHEREIRVRGYDLLHRLRKHQPVRAHVQVTPADLARDLILGLGLTLAAAEPGPLWQLLIQHRQSDLELLQEVTERCGLYLAVWDSRLHLLTLDGTGEAVPLVLGESLLEARIEVNGDLACREVHAAGWNPGRNEAHQGRSTAARVGRSVDATVAPSDLGGDGKRDLVGEAAQDDSHAAGLAQAELDRRVAREVTLWGAAAGDPRLRPGVPVDVTGVGADLKGRYVLTSVTHTVDSRLGFISEIATTPPAPSARPRGAGVTAGMVTQIDDPAGLGRVRAKLLAYDDVETSWMGVLTPGAGADKGLVVLPDVGDQVLVLFSHDDPGQGVILGGLYGVLGPPDSGGIAGGAVKRYTLVTPGQQRIQLDDEHNTIRFENSAGSYVELAPGTVRLHAGTALEIEAPGKPVVIRGQSIDFQKA